MSPVLLRLPMIVFLERIPGVDVKVWEGWDVCFSLGRATIPDLRPKRCFPVRYLSGVEVAAARVIV